MPRKKKQLKHKQQPVIIIAAIGKDRGIGYQGNLLFKIKEDMKEFKKLTLNHTVIMGRKTWESLPKNLRPLPDRDNIVITRNQNYHPQGAKVVHRFYQALEEASPNKKIFVIGGGEIYRQALSYADALKLTIVDQQKKADVYFPEFNTYFQKESSSATYTDEATGLSYCFVDYIKT